MNEHIQKVLDHPKRDHVIVGVLAFAGGAVSGYFYAKKRLETSYQITEVVEYDIEEDVEEHEIPGQMSMESIDIEEIKRAVEDVVEKTEDDEPVVRRSPVVIDEEVYSQHFGAVEGVEVTSETIEATIETDDAIIEVTQDIATMEEGELYTGPLVTTSNVFAADDDDWNTAEELKGRTPGAPYVLHKDEFFDDEMDFSQLTLTYYEGDQIMTDEDEKPVYNHERLVGPLMFGHGSGDPNVFYVRNHNQRAEYEIVRHTGLYSEEVLGLEIENNARVRDLKHSVRRFRPD
jgi:hypothetical protein